MPTTDFNAQQTVASLGATSGDSAANVAQVLAEDLHSLAAATGPIAAQQLVSEGDAKAWHFKMRGVDAGGNYVTWVVLGKPDPDGLLATRSNTVPVLTGSVVAGTGVILAKWGAVFPDGSG